MTKLTNKEQKDRLLELLINFDKLCKKNKIQYSLAYGTLLGAVRHRGFIPWDDDIDVMMTYDNYKKFLNLKSSLVSNDYYILDNTDKNYNFMFAKFVDKNTILISKIEDRFLKEIGLYIDIFPIENIDPKIKESLRFNFMLSLLVSCKWKHFFINKNYSKFNFRQIIRFFFFVMSRFIKPKKIISKLEKMCDCENTGYSCFKFESGKPSNCIKSSLFLEYTNLTFENNSFMCISNFDIYLKAIYGDYMKLPPERKRIPSHDYDAFLK